MSEGSREGTLDRKAARSWPDKIVSLAGRRARKTLCQAAGDRGWDVRPGAPQWIPRTPLHLYLLDTSDQQTVTDVVNWEDLGEIEEATQALSWSEATNALTCILAEADITHIPELQEPGCRNEMLISLSARYIAGTETFRRIPRQTPDTHFVILVYRPKGAGDPQGILRPFALVARDRQGLMQPGELKHVSRRIIEQDRAAHPDWFPSAKVLRL